MSAARADHVGTSETRGRPRAVQALDDGPGADRLWAAMPYVATVGGWLALLPFKRWFVSPDGVVYAALADRFAAGDLAGAVTTYWSPLYPALAAPLVALGVETTMALRLVLLATALLALPLLRSLSLRCGATRRGADVGTLLAVPLLVTAAWFAIYPELLLCVLALGLVWALTAPVPAGGRGTGTAVLAGVLGGLAYLAKAIGLPFAVAVVVLVGLARLVRPDRPRREVLRRAAISLALVAVVAGPWVAAVSAEAGEPTISSAGSYNARWAADGSLGTPLTYDGLYAPAGPDAVTPWEDPAALPDLRSEERGDGAVTGDERLDNVVEQLGTTLWVAVVRWWAVVPVALLGLALALRRGGTAAATALGLVGAAAVLVGGLSLLVVIERYLWTPMLASIPLAAAGLAALGGRRARPTTVVGVVLTGLVFVSLIPAFGLRFGKNQVEWRTAEQLEATAPLTGPVAGAQDWQATQMLAYLSGVPYVGTTGTDADAEDVAAAMRAVGARHLVVWGDDGPPGLPPSEAPVAVYDLTPEGFVVHGP
ncbi:hypothetical protein [Pseudokineococcus sp. 1T1Z-3]|uniref:hypothetical protein n=1 Tax=Pseudokineococcus sp. 1T1Z-3 TaxID=3132745 RepID=UPI0030986158